MSSLLKQKENVEGALIEQKKFSMNKIDFIVYASIILIFLLAITFFSPFYQRFVIEMMIFAILALSMDFLLGYGGLLNLAHTLFFGLNIYVISILFIDYQMSFFIAVLLAMSFTMIVAYLIGFFSCRLNGIQFAMVTLAFGELVYIIITKWRSLTGGFDGKRVNQSIELSVGSQVIKLTDTLPLLMIVAVMLLATYYFINRIVKSPFGNALISVHENEERAKFLGFNVFRIKFQSFLISAFFSAFAGVGYLLLKMFVSPNYVSWAFSGDVLLMTLIGGMGTLFGPLFGAMGFVWFKDWLSSYTENWMLVVGLLFMLVVVFFPRGLFGWLQKK